MNTDTTNNMPRTKSTATLPSVNIPTPVANAVPEPVPPAADPPIEVTEVAAEATIEARFTGLAEQLQQVVLSVRSLQAGLKALQRDYVKEAREAKKGGKRVPRAVRPPSERRAPSGFALPTELTPQLCAFLKLDQGTKLARVEVTRLINAYIKEHNLQEPADKRRILPDAALGALVSPADTPLTYFNLQGRIKHHFAK